MIYILYECDVCEKASRTKDEMPSQWGFHIPNGMGAWLVCKDCQEAYYKRYNTKIKLWGESNE